MLLLFWQTGLKKNIPVLQEPASAMFPSLCLFDWMEE
jgi:hypothetical protein